VAQCIALPVLLSVFFFLSFFFFGAGIEPRAYAALGFGAGIERRAYPAHARQVLYHRATSQPSVLLSE
jgi:hypothetical protein